MADPVYKRPGVKKRWCPTHVIGQWAYCLDNCTDSNDITKKGTLCKRLLRTPTLLL